MQPFFNKLFSYKKIISYLIVMILMTSPLLSISASVYQCNHSSILSSSKTSSSSTEKLANSQKINAQNTSMHDCCEETDAQCHCDDGKLSSSLLNTFSILLLKHLTPPFKQILQPSFISRVADSVYRPPITIL